MRGIRVYVCIQKRSTQLCSFMSPYLMTYIASYHSLPCFCLLRRFKFNLGSRAPMHCLRRLGFGYFIRLKLSSLLRRILIWNLPHFILSIGAHHLFIISRSSRQPFFTSDILSQGGRCRGWSSDPRTSDVSKCGPLLLYCFAHLNCKEHMPLFGPLTCPRKLWKCLLHLPRFRSVLFPIPPFFKTSAK